MLDKGSRNISILIEPVRDHSLNLLECEIYYNSVNYNCHITGLMDVFSKGCHHISVDIREFSLYVLS